MNLSGFLNRIWNAFCHILREKSLMFLRKKTAESLYIAPWKSQWAFPVFYDFDIVLHLDREFNKFSDDIG